MFQQDHQILYIDDSYECYFNIVKNYFKVNIDKVPFYSITRRLKECGEILGIGLVDHIIVGDRDRYFSFKENNKI